MLDASKSGCINHPGIEAAHRCKQCGKPVCQSCTVPGPTGMFCSGVCKEKHEAFLQRARQFDDKKSRKPISARIRGFLGWIIVLLAICLLVGVVSTIFELPVFSPLTRTVRGIIGI